MTDQSKQKQPEVVPIVNGDPLEGMPESTGAPDSSINTSPYVGGNEQQIFLFEGHSNR